MRRRYQSRHLNWVWLALLVFAVDIITKYKVSELIQLNQQVQVTDFFNLVHLHNTGAAFSFLSQASGWQNTFFMIIASVISMAVALWLFLSRDAMIRACGLSLILGGALGNLWDRLHYGYVIDFLDFHYAGWHWPAFNVADTAICIGAMFVLVDAFIAEKRSLSDEADA